MDVFSSLVLQFFVAFGLVALVGLFARWVLDFLQSVV